MWANAQRYGRPAEYRWRPLFNALYILECHAVTLPRRKKVAKIATWAPSHNFVGLYLRNEGTHRQSKKIVKQQYLL